MSSNAASAPVTTPHLPIELQRHIIRLAFASPPLSAPTEVVAARTAGLLTCCYVNQAWKEICQDLLMEDLAILDVEEAMFLVGMLQKTTKGETATIGRRVKILRVGDTRQEEKQWCFIGVWEELLDAISEVEEVSVHGLWISEAQNEAVAFDQVIRPCMKRASFARMAFHYQHESQVAFPNVTHLSLAGCDLLQPAVSGVVNLPPYTVIYKVFPRLEAVHIDWNADGAGVARRSMGTFYGWPNHGRADDHTLLKAFSAGVASALWPADQPLELLQVGLPHPNQHQTLSNLSFPATLDTIRIFINMPLETSFYSKRFLRHITGILSELPKLRNLYLPQVLRLPEQEHDTLEPQAVTVAKMKRKCEERGVKLVFLQELDDGMKHSEALHRLFWDDVERLQNRRRGD